MSTLNIFLQVLLVITSLLLIMFVLMHKGKGGGLSDMFGGGVSSNVGSSGVAEKNLNNITIGVSVGWVIIVIFLGVVQKVL